LDSFLGYLQWTREALRGYPLPIVLWLPSALLVEIAKKAPDFWSWRSGGTFTFGFAKLDFPISDADGKDPIFKPIDNPKKSSSVLSVKQLEDSLAEALTTWGEDSANIEPIYAQLGDLYSDRVSQGITENLNQEIQLAETYLNKAITLQKRFNRKSDLAYALSNLGYMYRFLGYWDKVESLYKESLQIREEFGDRAGMATSWLSLGDIERKLGNWDAAESFYRQSLQLFTELGDLASMAIVSFDFALLEKQRGNLPLAQQYYDQAKTIYQQLGAIKDLERIEKEWNLI
jgi:tetratricopeptide (TPR) repeat protein